jgi:large subunit ribosomal protein L18
MNKAKKLNNRKTRRIGRVRAIISGTAERPRLVVNRSNQYIHAQLIDDEKQRTLLSASSFDGKKAAKAGTAKTSGGTKEKKTKSEQAFAVGESLGKKAVEKGIKQVVFDRRSYQFHGRVKNFADGAKKGGLKI